MSHRTVIFNKTKEALQEPDVRAQLTTQQCQRVDEILQSPEPADEDFRYLGRRLQQIYCTND